MFFVEHVSHFTSARLAAQVGGETTAGMSRSDSVRAAHVCSGFTVGDVMNARFFFEANIRGFDFFQKKKRTSCLNFQANMFTGLCSSATRMKKVPWALCLGDIGSTLICLEALEGDMCEPCCVEDSTSVAGGFQQKQNQAWVDVDVDKGNTMVNACRGASIWLYRFHSQTPSADEL